MEPILDIRGLNVTFRTPAGLVRAADGVSFSIEPGETLGLVGESGCGKSVTALSVLKLLPIPPAEISAESIRWKDRDLLRLSVSEMIALRGRDLSVIFQEPLTSFNPVKRIGEQIAEAWMIHHPGGLSADAADLAVKSLEQVGIRNPAKQVLSFPHELSGGMRQRAMIAMALVNRPQLLIADEPTTALDVTIQAQILELIAALQEQNGMAVLFITHNLGVVAQTARRVIVMYAGRIVEQAESGELFRNPLHPYTRGLLDSIPNPKRKGSLYAIPGGIPDPLALPAGCYFHPRCRFAKDVCRQQYPEYKEQVPGHGTACWLYGS